MNANSRFLEEAKVLEAKWAKHGLLNGISDKYSRQVTAVLLESQRLLNEAAQPVSSVFCPQCGVMLEGIAKSSYRCPCCKQFYLAGWEEV